MADEKPVVENPTLEYYPEMLRSEKLLVVDHNILRFHTFDLLQRLLLEKDHFIRMLKAWPQLETFVRAQSQQERLKWAYLNLSPDACKAIFGDTEQYHALLKQYISDEKMLDTPTALTYGIADVFASPYVSGTILRQKGDKRPDKDLKDTFDIHWATNIGDMNLLADFILSNGYTAVIIDTSQKAATLSYKTNEVVYMIPTYRFNFSEDGKFLGMTHFTLTELQNKNSYGVFHPYRFVVQEGTENNE